MLIVEQIDQESHSRIIHTLTACDLHFLFHIFLSTPESQDKSHTKDCLLAGWLELPMPQSNVKSSAAF